MRLKSGVLMKILTRDKKGKEASIPEGGGVILARRGWCHPLSTCANNGKQQTFRLEKRMSSLGAAKTCSKLGHPTDAFNAAKRQL